VSRRVLKHPSRAAGARRQRIEMENESSRRATVRLSGRPAGREGFSLLLFAGRASERGGRVGRRFVDEALTGKTRHRVYPTDAARGCNETLLRKRFRLARAPLCPGRGRTLGAREACFVRDAATDSPGVKYANIRLEKCSGQSDRPARCRRVRPCWVQNTRWGAG